MTGAGRSSWSCQKFWRVSQLQTHLSSRLRSRSSGNAWSRHPQSCHCYPWFLFCCCLFAVKAMLMSNPTELIMRHNIMETCGEKLCRLDLYKLWSSRGVQHEQLLIQAVTVPLTCCPFKISKPAAAAAAALWSAGTAITEHKQQQAHMCQSFREMHMQLLTHACHA